MNIEINSSKEEVLSTNKLFTGIAQLRVIALNPTQEELKKLGFNPQKEPEYKGKTDDDKDRIRLDFYVECLEIGSKESGFYKTKITFFMSDEERLSQSNKNQLINNFGQTSWQEKDALPTWFKTEGLRNAYNGEEDVINFIRVLANVKSDGEAYFEDPSKIAKGNITELTKLLKNPKIKDNTFLGLLMVTESQGNSYQAVHNKVFGRDYENRNPAIKAFKKNCSDDYGKPKGDYQNSLELKEYVESTVIEEVPAGASMAAAPQSAGSAVGGKLSF